MLRNHIPLKLFSGIIAYGLWHLMGSLCHTTRSLNTQISCYNIPQNRKLIHPESVTITMRGRRDLLASFNKDALTAYIDATSFDQDKEYIIHIDTQNLFLPDEIKVIRCCPSPIMVKSNYIESSPITV